MIGSQENNINIKNLVIDMPPNNTREFYVERDIADSDWQGICQTLATLRSKGQFDDAYLTLALPLKTLKPSLLDQISDLDSDVEKVAEPIYREINKFKALADQAKAQIVFPKNVNKFWVGPQTFNQHTRSVLFKVDGLFSLAINSLDSPIPSDSDLQYIADEIQNDNEEDFIKGYEFSLLRIASFDKAWNLELEKYIEACKKELRFARKGKDWVNFAENLFALSVLCAQKIDVDNEGLHITLDKWVTEEISSLPETRKF